jgi:5'-nucleotidase
LIAAKPLILLTNDDGICSPGLLAAAEAVHDLGELLIVAPVTQQTGMGRASPQVTNGSIEKEVLRVSGQELIAYGLPASPAQAVTYGVLVIAARRPDLVISGINYGENLGTSVTVSGTVGAALQAADLGIPGLAVSLETDKAYHYNHGQDVDWEAAGYFTHQLAGAMLQRQLPFDVDVLKVDIPADATARTPWRLTRQSRQSYYEVLRLDEQPETTSPPRLDYRVSVHWETLEPDSDIHAFASDRVVSVTPLSQDLTSRTELAALEEMLRAV